MHINPLTSDDPPKKNGRWCHAFFFYWPWGRASSPLPKTIHSQFFFLGITASHYPLGGVGHLGFKRKLTPNIKKRSISGGNPDQKPVNRLGKATPPRAGDWVNVWSAPSCITFFRKPTKTLENGIIKWYYTYHGRAVLIGFSWRKLNKLMQSWFNMPSAANTYIFLCVNC